MDAPTYEVRILAPAQRELEEIAMVHLRLVDTESARKITDRILTSLERLTRNPEMGVRCKDKTLRLNGYRMLICGHYLCIYRLIVDTVYVYHIADGRTDYPRHMTDLTE